MLQISFTLVGSLADIIVTGLGLQQFWRKTFNISICLLNCISLLIIESLKFLNPDDQVRFLFQLEFGIV